MLKDLWGSRCLIILTTLHWVSWSSCVQRWKILVLRRRSISWGTMACEGRCWRLLHFWVAPGTVESVCRILILSDFHSLWCILRHVSRQTCTSHLFLLSVRIRLVHIAAWSMSANASDIFTFSRNLFTWAHAFTFFLGEVCDCVRQSAFTII